mmetsp:Transcript_9665/g.13012  ORF Transcript_9665/g.13012 Transcript_9665/m.13012 type:complete len:247 (-) Transcript_9665:65-805(-)
MKLNIANPATGAQRLIEFEDQKKLRVFFDDKRIASEVSADPLGEEYKGYVFKITGGNDKQGFPMKQGVMQNKRVRLLLDKNSNCFVSKRAGHRRRRSVRGCIVGNDLSVLNVIIVKKGEKELPGLTDAVQPLRLGPKRASKIRKLFKLDPKDDVRKYVVRRTFEKNGKTVSKAPKIQRLVTPRTLQHKRHLKAIKRRRAEKAREEAAEYARLLVLRNKEKRALVSKRRKETASSVKKVSQKVSAKK